MPGITYGDSGVNRDITAITYGDGGINRSIIEVWYGDAGTNRLVWPSGTVSLTNHSPYASNVGVGLIAATFTLDNAGLASETTLPGGTIGHAPEWLSAGTPANYDCRWTTLSGTLSTGTSGTWQNLGTTRAWSRNAGAGVGVMTCRGTLEIRDAATLIVLATATIQLDAERF